MKSNRTKNKVAPMHSSMLLHAIFLCLLAASISPQAKPDCLEKCGNISIPYPFGVGDRSCFKENGHQLICNTTYDPPMLFLNTGSNVNTPVLNISLQGQLTITTFVSYQCYSISGPTSDRFNQKITLDPIYAWSDTRNRFTAIGCDTSALMYDTTDTILQSGCVALCRNSSDVSDGSCSGIGCCQTSIPKGLGVLNMQLGTYNNHTTSWTYNPCSYAFLADQDQFEFITSDLWNFRNNSEMSFENKIVTPIVVDWVAGLETCEEAKKNWTSYSCGNNSVCSHSTNGPGYLCYCKLGYQGNPYLPNGCQDIDECADPNHNPCEGICNNWPGGFSCTCPPGTTDDGQKDGSRCIPSENQFPILEVALGVGLGILLLLIACSWIYWGLKKRHHIILRENLFKQNGGFLLQQQLFSHDRPIETMKIFTAGELEKATNNFDEDKVVGRGGYGTVYKGVLHDRRMVAIKKSRVVDKNQIEQFINEVVILSQINHNNVVRLLGCCLETEVPLLVYEFITNGTLYHHIHDEGDAFFLSWEDRLRIASETAGALAYLHSAASPPIIHRDIKSTNILLDNYYRAKVSDFGASRLVPLDHAQLSTLVQGTMGYLDPEYFLTSNLTEKSDVYSFGVVLAELLTGQKAISFERPIEERNLALNFVSSMRANRLARILDSRVVVQGNENQVKQVAELAKRCLHMSGDERPTMKEVTMELEGLRSHEKHHPWIQRKPSFTHHLLEQPMESLNTKSAEYDSIGLHVMMELERGR